MIHLQLGRPSTENSVCSHSVTSGPIKFCWERMSRQMEAIPSFSSVLDALPDGPARRLIISFFLDMALLPVVEGRLFLQTWEVMPLACLMDGSPRSAPQLSGQASRT